MTTGSTLQATERLNNARRITDKKKATPKNRPDYKEISIKTKLTLVSLDNHDKASPAYRQCLNGEPMHNVLVGYAGERDLPDAMWRRQFFLMKSSSGKCSFSGASVPVFVGELFSLLVMTGYSFGSGLPPFQRMRGRSLMKRSRGTVSDCCGVMVRRSRLRKRTTKEGIISPDSLLFIMSYSRAHLPWRFLFLMKTSSGGGVSDFTVRFNFARLALMIACNNIWRCFAFTSGSVGENLDFVMVSPCNALRRDASYHGGGYRFVRIRPLMNSSSGKCSGRGNCGAAGLFLMRSRSLAARAAFSFCRNTSNGTPLSFMAPPVYPLLTDGYRYIFRTIFALNRSDHMNKKAGYTHLIPNKAGIGILTPLEHRATHDAPASFLLSVNTHTLSMVGCMGPTSVGLVSLCASCENPVQSTASEFLTSGGGYYPYARGAAEMVVFSRRINGVVHCVNSRPVQSLRGEADVQRRPTLVHSQAAFIWRFLVLSAARPQIIHVTACTEREARSRCPSGCVAVFAARIRQGVSHV